MWFVYTDVCGLCIPMCVVCVYRCVWFVYTGVCGLCIPMCEVCVYRCVWFVYTEAQCALLLTELGPISLLASCALYVITSGSISYQRGRA